MTRITWTRRGSKPSVYFDDIKYHSKESNDFISKKISLKFYVKPLRLTLYISCNRFAEVGFNLPQRIIKNVFYKRNEKIFISHDAYLKRSGEIRKIIQGKCSAMSGQGPRPCITFM